ncbi:MAG: sigma-E processing peptidase SpoIIGA [Oscillospiraceae bacterium]|nr:sigma-E processing peptidase SpoIIGA [Oscillospiraceae bacterium]
MRQSVYIDILIVINIFVNYFLLLETSFINKEKPKRWRILLSSALGGIYSLVIILPPLHMVLSVFLKIVFSASMIFAAFKVYTAKHFLRLFAVFFAVNFIFAGLMFAIWIFLEPHGMQFNNGAIYFNVDALTLTVMTVFCYVVVNLISRVSRKSAPYDKIYNITVDFMEKQVSGKALVDTGNSLCDVFSGTPVVVAEYDFLKDIMPKDVSEFMQDENSFDTQKILDDHKGRIRLIPFDSLGGDGLLKAFRPDKLTLEFKNNVTEIETVYIAVKNSLLSNGEYRAILNPAMLNDCEKEASLSP